MDERAATPVLMGKSLQFFKRYVPDYRLVEWTPETLEAVLRATPGVRAIIAAGDHPLPAAIENLDSLGLVALMGAGYDGLQTDRLFARGVEISHTPGANAEDVADHGMALFLALVRRVLDGDRRVREGLWVDYGLVTKLPSVRNLRVGVVGMGAIGVALARRLTAFGCRVSWYGPRPKPEIEHPRAGSVLDLARESDVLFLAHKANESNRGLVDRAVLEALGPDGMLVNLSRGTAVDEPMLIAALRDGTLGGAAIDVFDPEPVRDTRWADVPNCVLAPHIGGAGLGAWDNIGAMVTQNLDRFFAGQPLATPVPRPAA